LAQKVVAEKDGNKEKVAEILAKIKVLQGGGGAVTYPKPPAYSAATASHSASTSEPLDSTRESKGELKDVIIDVSTLFKGGASIVVLKRPPSASGSETFVSSLPPSPSLSPSLASSSPSDVGMPSILLNEPLTPAQVVSAHNVSVTQLLEETKKQLGTARSTLEVESKKWQVATEALAARQQELLAQILQTTSSPSENKAVNNASELEEAVDQSAVSVILTVERYEPLLQKLFNGLESFAPSLISTRQKLRRVMQRLLRLQIIRYEEFIHQAQQTLARFNVQIRTAMSIQAQAQTLKRNDSEAKRLLAACEDSVKTRDHLESELKQANEDIGFEFEVVSPVTQAQVDAKSAEVENCRAAYKSMKATVRQQQQDLLKALATGFFPELMKVPALNVPLKANQISERYGPPISY
jgi:hypothetical protein